MASRLEKFSTIVKRTEGLLKGNVLKKKPLWYDVYVRHPPHLEPYAFRKTQDVNVKEIIYEEDIEKSRLYLKSKFEKKSKNHSKQNNDLPELGNNRINIKNLMDKDVR